MIIAIVVVVVVCAGLSVNSCRITQNLNTPAQYWWWYCFDTASTYCLLFLFEIHSSKLKKKIVRMLQWIHSYSTVENEIKSNKMSWVLARWLVGWLVGCRWSFNHHTADIFPMKNFSVSKLPNEKRMLFGGGGGGNGGSAKNERKKICFESTS